MEKRYKYINIFLILLFISGIANGLEDSRKSLSERPTSDSAQNSPITHLLLTESEGRIHHKRQSKTMRRRHILRNRGDVDQSSQYQNQQPQNQHHYQQPQNQHNYQQPQNQQNYQQPQNQQNYQQPQNQQNYPQPQIQFHPAQQYSYPLPFQNPFLPPQQPNINNYYYPNTPNMPFFQQPFGSFGVGPFIIIQIPYCPTNDQPKDDTPKVTTGVRIDVKDDDIPSIDESLYRDTPTGISLKPIPPARPPSIVAPPAIREESEPLLGVPQNRPNLPTTRRPVTTPRSNVRRRTTTTTPAPFPNYDDDEDYSNSCATAIVQCCTPRMDMECFEKANCPFIFDDPCEDLRNAANEIARKKTMTRK